MRPLVYWSAPIPVTFAGLEASLEASLEAGLEASLQGVTADSHRHASRPRCPSLNAQVGLAGPAPPRSQLSLQGAVVVR